MAINRETTLKQVDRLIRQGKLDGAIAEYVRLVEDQPGDWSAVNALGDLYVRAGDVDRAVAQFTRVADHLFGEGFLPKAAALYKKTLKVKKDDDHTLLRLSEIAARQGLLADARAYLRQLGRYRSDRGDSRGAAGCLVGLASLDEADVETKMAGARAAQGIGDVAKAKALFSDAAAELASEGRKGDAIDALAEAAALDPADANLRGRLAREYVAAGELDRAREFLTRETAGSNPDLLYALGRTELAAGHDAEARSIFTRLISVAPGRSADIVRVSDEMAAAGYIEAAFGCIEVIVDDALLVADWGRGIAALQTFLKHGPHVPALVRLVALAADGNHGDVMTEAQAQLADAYLDAGRGGEARVLADALVRRDAASHAHVERLRRALVLEGVEDPEDAIARCREPQPAVPEVAGPIVPEEKPEGAAPEAPRRHEDAPALEDIEIDLTDALAGMDGRGRAQ